MVIGPDDQSSRIGQGNQAAQPGQGHRGQQQLVAKAGLTLRQNYNRVAPELAGQIARLLTPGNTSSCVDCQAILTQRQPKEVFVDLGYRGATVPTGIKAYHRKLRRGITARLKRDIRRCSAIEPVIGHMKNDGRLRRNWLQGTEGNAFHAMLCGCGHNLRMILRRLRFFPALILVRLHWPPANDDGTSHRLTRAYALAEMYQFRAVARWFLLELLHAAKSLVIKIALPLQYHMPHYSNSCHGIASASFSNGSLPSNCIRKSVSNKFD